MSNCTDCNFCGSRLTVNCNDGLQLVNNQNSQSEYSVDIDIGTIFNKTLIFNHPTYGANYTGNGSWRYQYNFYSPNLWTFVRPIRCYINGVLSTARGFKDVCGNASSVESPIPNLCLENTTVPSDITGGVSAGFSNQPCIIPLDNNLNYCALLIGTSTLFCSVSFMKYYFNATDASTNIPFGTSTLVDGRTYKRDSYAACASYNAIEYSITISISCSHMDALGRCSSIFWGDTWYNRTGIMTTLEDELTLYKVVHTKEQIVGTGTPTQTELDLFNIAKPQTLTIAVT